MSRLTIRWLYGVGVLIIGTASSSLAVVPTVVARQNPTDSKTLRLTTGTFTVPPGDYSECFYTAVTTERELAIVAASGRQGQDGHHLTVYYTDNAREPQHHPCASEEMVGWHRVAGATGRGGKGEGLQLPGGLAMRVPAGRQLVVQSHYINTTGTTITTEDAVTLHLADPHHVRVYANMFYFFNNDFEIPPRSTYQSVTSCTVPRDVSAVQLAGHMHEHGTHYTLETVSAEGERLATLYEEDWGPRSVWNPPVQRYLVEQPLVLRAGTRLRQTCQWHNPSDQPLRYPREMCIAIFLYFPDEGPLSCQAETL